jgi:hypothetical protein
LAKVKTEKLDFVIDNSVKDTFKVNMWSDNKIVIYENLPVMEKFMNFLHFIAFDMW